MLSIRLLPLLAAMACVSCVAPRTITYTNQAFKPGAGTELGYLPPLSAMTLLVGDQNRSRVDWFYSAMVSRVEKRSLLHQNSWLPLAQQVPVDSLEQQALTREAREALRTWAITGSPESLAFPLLDRLVAHQPQRFTLVLLSQGFSRSSDNYARANTRAGQNTALYGVAGAYASGSVPVKTRTSLCALVYDSEQHRIVYACESTEAHEPLDQARTERHLQRLLGPDFGYVPPGQPKP